MTPTKQQKQNLDTQLLAGTQKRFATTQSLSFGGSTHTPAEIVAALQSRIAATNAETNAQVAFHAAVKAMANAQATTKPLVSQYRAFVLAQFGEDATTLVEFGLAPRKAPTRTPSTSVVAAAKAKATRKARGTLGSVQKKAVTGAVTGVTIVPVTAVGPTPTWSATPAATATAGPTAGPPPSPALK